MKKGTVIRKITESDREVFLEMSREFYSSDAVLHEIPSSYHEHAFDELMRSDNYLICYIFEAEGCTVGYAMLNKMFMHECGGVVLWVEELYIRESCRGMGLGHEFFSFLEKNEPASRYRLEVESENLRARSLYERLGYETLPYMQMIKDNG